MAKSCDWQMYSTLTDTMFTYGHISHTYQVQTCPVIFVFLIESVKNRTILISTIVKNVNVKCRYIMKTYNEMYVPCSQ